MLTKEDKDNYYIGEKTGEEIPIICIPVDIAWAQLIILLEAQLSPSPLPKKKRE